MDEEKSYFDSVCCLLKSLLLYVLMFQVSTSVYFHLDILGHFSCLFEVKLKLPCNMS